MTRKAARKAKKPSRTNLGKRAELAITKTAQAIVNGQVASSETEKVLARWLLEFADRAVGLELVIRLVSAIHDKDRMRRRK